MPNELPIPTELDHMIEKREKADRRSDASKGSEDSATESTDKEQLNREDRRENSRRESD